MNRKKNQENVSEDLVKKLIKKDLQRIQRNRQIVSFESNKLKINGITVADFTKLMDNNIDDIVYQKNDNKSYESIIYYDKKYEQGLSEGKYYILTSREESNKYFDSLTITTVKK